MPCDSSIFNILSCPICRKTEGSSHKPSPVSALSKVRQSFEKHYHTCLFMNALLVSHRASSAVWVATSVHRQPFVPLHLCIDSHLCRCIVQRLCVAVFMHPCITALCGCLYASLHNDFVRPLSCILARPAQCEFAPQHQKSRAMPVCVSGSVAGCRIAVVWVAASCSDSVRPLSCILCTFMNALLVSHPCETLGVHFIRHPCLTRKLRVLQIGRAHV